MIFFIKIISNYHKKKQNIMKFNNQVQSEFGIVLNDRKYNKNNRKLL